MNEDKLVLQALQEGVKFAVTTASFPADKVKFVGRTFKPEADKPWLEVVWIPNNPIGEFWSGGKTYRGLMRLILHWPLDDKGAYEALTKAGEIAESFKLGTAIANSGIIVRITDSPNISPIEQQSENLYVIALRYNCFKTSFADLSDSGQSGVLLDYVLSSTVKRVESLTEAEYNAITTPDPDTIYFITD